MEHPEAVRSISFSPDGRHIASACDGGVVRVYDVYRHTLTREFSGNDGGGVRCVQYSPDSSIIAIAANDCTIWLWNAWTGALVKGPLCGHRYHVSGISFSSDGQQLLSSSADETIRGWDVTSGKCVLGPLYGHGEPVGGIGCSVDRKHFASFSNNAVRVWKIQDGIVTLLRPPMRSNNIPQSAAGDIDDLSFMQPAGEADEMTEMGEVDRLDGASGKRESTALTRIFRRLLGSNTHNRFDNEAVQLETIIEIGNFEVISLATHTAP
ncbi:WD40 repeat-like protein [Coniophora puteana RWD-64-598 SS2]|uniref:WD40 repeat-like protein n=1 Tax=Coniophora puteana (strain RWD-64-598) TaxID=741705 RepID=A0A5M3MXZ7_CONPW|nr:WD40 repeat-like protein [Coniophora puteana RWD-64-598 SS2]EIW84008.1 WD40 repeat-like protein [Coniophora puteana RWD-64-598 SS2]